MKKFFIISILFSLLILPACDFMDELPSDWHTPDDAFRFENTYLRNVNQCYWFIKGGYNRVSGAFLDAATDDGISTVQSSNIHKLAQGFYSAASPIESPWSLSYGGIRQTLFTEKYLNEVTLFINGMNDAQVEAIKVNCRAQVRSLRALYEFDLLRHYGGYPIIDTFMTIDDPRFKTIKRNSFEECVNNIVALCDSSVAGLELKDANYGRMEKGSALAIKAQTLVYAASALYNRIDNTNPVLGYVNATPTEIQSRWEAAAAACAAVINLKNGAANRYTLNASYSALFNVQPNSNNEFIVVANTPKSNGLENRQYPVTLSKTSGGGTVPSQQLVDAFTNADGSTYTRAAGAAPAYTGRDKRFDMIIGYNGALYGARGKIYTQLGKGETNDGLNKEQDRSTNTGYYLRKFLDTNINFFVATPATTYHMFPIIRLADVYLMYAEAMTQAYGFEADPQAYGMTAKQAVQAIRTRAGFTAATDKYFDDMGTNKASQLQKIYDERRIELCFEECRYFDLRRWMKTEVLNQPIKGMRIDNSDTDVLTYTEITVDNLRNFEDRMYFTPIPRNEILVFPELEQNPGWEQ